MSSSRREQAASQTLKPLAGQGNRYPEEVGEKGSRAFYKPAFPLGVESCQ